MTPTALMLGQRLSAIEHRQNRDETVPILLSKDGADACKSERWQPEPAQFTGELFQRDGQRLQHTGRLRIRDPKMQLDAVSQRGSVSGCGWSGRVHDRDVTPHRFISSAPSNRGVHGMDCIPRVTA